MINMYLPTILFYFTTAISDNYGENLEFKQDQGLFFFRFFFFLVRLSIGSPDAVQYISGQWWLTLRWTGTRSNSVLLCNASGK